MDIGSACCDRFNLKIRIVKGRHVQVGSITSNPWLVLSSFIHCMSVDPLSNRMVC